MIVAEILPVEKSQAPQTLLASIENHLPAAVVCLGEAAHQAAISVERVAINLMDYRIPDNFGNQVIDQSVIEGGPDAYLSTLPVRGIFEEIRVAGIPVELSLSAGAFLCNQVFYTGRHFVSHLENPIPLGFIHLPALPEQAALNSSPSTYPSMCLEMDILAVRLAIEVVARSL
jgi:pyroglutamyl-peptidase